MNSTTKTEVRDTTGNILRPGMADYEIRAQAIANLNKRQQARNLYTNIGEKQVACEIKRIQKTGHIYWINESEQRRGHEST